MKSGLFSIISVLFFALSLRGAEKPWEHGDLRVSDNGLYMQHEDGTPFFWLGDTGWLLPQRLDRDEAQHYLEQTAREGFNVVQIAVDAGRAYLASDMKELPAERLLAWDAHGVRSLHWGYNLAARDAHGVRSLHSGSSELFNLTTI